MCIILESCEETSVNLPLRLHPLNFDKSKVNGLAPISQRKASSVLTPSRDCCVDTDALVNARIAHNKSHPIEKHPHVVQLGSGVISIVEELPNLVRVKQQIPLLFAEVSLGYDPVLQCEVVILADTLVEGCLVKELKRQRHASDIWLLCLEGEQSLIGGVMQRVGAHGAIRNDVDRDFMLDEMERIVDMPLHYTLPPVVEPINVNACTPDFCVKFGNSSLGDIQHEVAMLVAAGRHPNIVKFYTVFTHEFSDTLHTYSEKTRETRTFADQSRRGSRAKTENDISFLREDRFGSTSVNLCKRFGYIMDYYGRTLFGVVIARTLREDQLKCVASGLLKALNHMHSIGVAHCNVIPANIQMARCGRPILSGFDRAVRVTDVNNLVQRRGSPEILAPEILLGLDDDVCEKIDLFALGAVLYFAASGLMPFQSRRLSKLYKSIVYGEVDWSLEKFNDVSEEFLAMVRGLLVKKASERLNSDDFLKSAWIGLDEDDVPASLPTRSIGRLRTRAATRKVTLSSAAAKSEELQRLMARTLILKPSKVEEVVGADETERVSTIADSVGTGNSITASEGPSVDPVRGFIKGTDSDCSEKCDAFDERLITLPSRPRPERRARLSHRISVG